MSTQPVGKLGKKAVKYDRRTLALAPYIQKRKRPVIPKTHTLSKKTLLAFPVLGMMQNDKKSNCTIVGISHGEQARSTYGGKPHRPTDAEILTAYNLINGGIDEGAAMLDALKMARSVGIGGNKIDGYVSVNPMDEAQMRTAHYLFGGLYIGANLPMAVRSQDLWDVGDGPEFAPGSLGGHAMTAYDFAPRGMVLCTWGRLQRVTWPWIRRYVDECYAILDMEFLGDDKRSPQGLSFKALLEDLQAMR